MTRATGHIEHAIYLFKYVHKTLFIRELVTSYICCMQHAVCRIASYSVCGNKFCLRIAQPCSGVYIVPFIYKVVVQSLHNDVCVWAALNRNHWKGILSILCSAGNLQSCCCCWMDGKFRNNKFIRVNDLHNDEVSKCTQTHTRGRMHT